MSNASNIRAIRMFGYRLPIKVVKDLGDHGQYRSHPEPQILIDRGQSPDSRVRSTWHEALEAFNDLHGVGMSENQIRAVEQWVVEMHRRNPALVRATLNRKDGRE